MAREELGTKRVCPETGRKFYDLARDPIVSPYTGMSYPLSFFEGEKDSTKPDPVEEKPEVKEEKPVVEAEAETEDDDEEDTELVSLEEADEEASGPDIPEIEDEEAEIVADDDDDDTFLEEEEEDDDDIGIVVEVENEDEV
ncbi:MAG: TIGR02300 family protein [Pseudomonadota bacterium]